eukprot:CAMPEP_0174866612 /NCGR_PEP_ID=MMETSP1114-20130205/62403_1 /TAXON_ID=312471 /ORGANISM="Neobodo designis, Strain CCAP 1951/1" /LENGTH=183 /DNA_ID=CAMNT_0016101775 /DNA_START=28 /DNA_END=579 /DNA_ORIENTATION=-
MSIPRIVLVIVAACLLFAGAAAYPDELIRCKVCERAITHVWERAEALRSHCQTGVQDVRCDHHHADPNEIDKMAWGVCDALPTTYHAIHESEFDLVLKEGDTDPVHTAEAARAIKNSCIRWLHTGHSAEEVGRVVRANIEAGKPGHVIMPGIRRRFCKKACGYKHVSSRVPHTHPVHEEREEL